MVSELIDLDFLKEALEELRHEYEIRANRSEEANKNNSFWYYSGIVDGLDKAYGLLNGESVKDLKG